MKLRASLWVLLLLPLAAGRAEDAEISREREPDRAVRTADAEELEAAMRQAQERLDRGDRRRARRMYARVARTATHTRAGVEAAYRQARLLEEEGRAGRAVEAYIQVLEQGAGPARHAEVLERLYALGEDLVEQRRRFLGIPVGREPERAVAAFEAVVRHGPRWEHAHRAQLMIGRARERQREYEEALRAYHHTFTQYIHKPSGEEAAFARARLLDRMSRRQPHNEAMMLNAWEAARFYLALYPQGRFVEEAQTLRDTLYERRAGAAYRKARFYDRRPRHPRAAAIAYRLLLEAFPQSTYAEEAAKRLRLLEQKAAADGDAS